MKKFISLFLIGFSFCTFSCEELEVIIPDIDLNVDDLSFTFPVLIPEEEDRLSGTFDIAIEDSQVLDNLQNIKVLAVKGFVYTISDVQKGEGTIINGKVTVGKKSVKLNNVEIRNGTSAEISDPAFINALEKEFKDDGAAQIEVDGLLDNDNGSVFQVTFQSVLAIKLTGS